MCSTTTTTITHLHTNFRVVVCVLLLSFAFCTVSLAADAVSRFPAKCFFSVTQAQGFWYITDPNGNLTLLKGVNSVNYLGDLSPALNTHPYNDAVAAKFYSEKQWASNILDRLRSWQFNMLGYD